MKSFKSYLPESFITELAEAPIDSISPVNGGEASGYPNPVNSKYGNRELNIGDPVVITGNVEFSGKTGDVAGFDNEERKSFIVVNLYNHGKHSFHSSDVEYNDYADDEERNEGDDEDEDDRALYSLRKLSGY
jgi:hypothetical protein